MKSIRPYTILTFLLLAAFCAIPQSADAQTQPISLVSPVPNSTLNNSAVTFQWTNRTGVTQAWLAIGTKQGGADILKWTQIWPSLSILVSNIPMTGGKVYFEFWYYTGTWNSLITNFNTVDLLPKVQLTSPAAGTTLSNSAVTFQWTTPQGVSEAWMALGTTVGANGTVKDDILRWEQVWGNGSKVVTNIPMTGNPVYFEFWYKAQGYWKSIKETFQTANQMGTVQLVSPLPGITLLSSVVTFQWTNRLDVTEAWLGMGTKKGSNDTVVTDVEPWVQVWPSLTKTVTGIPMDGRTIYFEFWYKASGQWYPLKTTFQTEDQRPSPLEMIKPDSDETLNSNTVEFEWTGRPDVVEQWLAIGTVAGAGNIVNWIPVTGTTYTAANIPLNGNTVYFELWYKTNLNQWYPLRASYLTPVSTTCGNGTIETGEACDGGSRGCTASGGYLGTQACLITCAGYGGCQSSQYCGDGIKNGSEACDDGALNGQAGKCNGVCTGTGPGTTSGAYQGSPVNGNPISIPGRIQAEYFNEGGQGAGYYDVNPGHQLEILYSYKPVFRTNTDVEIKDMTTTDYVVGYMEVGEWLDYTVNVAASGTYTMRARIASLGGGGSLEVLMNGVSLTGSTPITGNTNCWFSTSNYSSCGKVVEKVVNLTAGAQKMRIKVQSSGIDIDWIEFVSGGGAPVCGNGVQEQGESCDHGSQNGQPGKCNTSCSGTVPTSSSGVPQSVRDAEPGNWSVVWNDEFDNFSYAKWGKSGETHPATGHNWTDKYGNMTGWDPQLVFIRNGNLVLKVSGSGNTWHAGMVHQAKIAGTGWKYGYFEVRFKPPKAAANSFTAPFWMMPQWERKYLYGGSPWPASGEIDIVEQFNVNLPAEGKIAYSNLHYLKNNAHVAGPVSDYTHTQALENEWHTFGLHWFRDPANNNKITMRFMHNGVEYARITQDTWGGQFNSTAPFDQPFYILMGIHAGTGYGPNVGNGAGQVPNTWNGSELLIDYVRVYQRQ